MARKSLLDTLRILSPVFSSVSQEAADRCVENHVEDIDGLDMLSPYELFGQIVHSAHQFIDLAVTGDCDDDGVSDAELALEALRGLNFNVTLYLYQVHREITKDVQEENGEEGEEGRGITGDGGCAAHGECAE